MADPFLAAICASPADDTTRLVYADWLDERSEGEDAARAAFIRGQVANPAEEIPVGVLPEAEAAAAKFRAGCGLNRPAAVDSELRELERLGATTAFYSRGFVSSVVTVWQRWREQHAEFRAAFPLCETCLTDWPTYFEQAHAGEWIDFDDPAYFWSSRGECIDALERRYAGLSFFLPTIAQPTPLPLEAVGRVPLAELLRAVGTVNEKPFAGRPARTLLLRDVLAPGGGPVTCRLMPNRPGHTFSNPHYAASDFDTLLAAPPLAAA